MVDVVIVGGGAIGLLTALKLADEGISVRLLDQSVPRPPASWAGGGILSALFPWRYSDALTALTLPARQAYVALSARLGEQDCPPLEVASCGLLMPGPPDFEDAASWAARFKVTLQEIRAESVEPRLGDEAAIWMPEVGHIRNPRLLKGLRRLLRQAGVSIESEQAQAVSRVAGGWQVVTDKAVLRASRVMISAGAWSAPLLEPFGIHLPVSPVKGEMLLYPASVSAPGCILLREAGYIIPRQDGSMLVGSTMLPGCDDQRPTQPAYQRLRQTAGDLWGPLADIEPAAQWSGLRPGNDRDHPFLGEVPGQPGLFVATGHFRNGLVCAPASAGIMAALLLGQEPDIDPAPYSISPSSSSPP